MNRRQFRPVSEPENVNKWFKCYFKVDEKGIEQWRKMDADRMLFIIESTKAFMKESICSRAMDIRLQIIQNR